MSRLERASVWWRSRSTRERWLIGIALGAVALLPVRDLVEGWDPGRWGQHRRELEDLRALETRYDQIEARREEITRAFAAWEKSAFDNARSAEGAGDWVRSVRAAAEESVQVMAMRPTSRHEERVTGLAVECRGSIAGLAQFLEDLDEIGTELVRATVTAEGTDGKVARASLEFRLQTRTSRL